MRTEAGILERIFTLTRGDLDSAVFPLPHPPSLFGETETVRILRMSRFWQKGVSPSNALLQHTLALLAAFHAQNSHFAFVIRGIDRNIECWIGAQKGQFTKSSLASMLRGALPDVRIDEQASLLDRQTPYPFGTILTGTPSLRSDGDGAANTPSDQIESALRGLVGRDWMFIVSARPRRAPQVAQSINDIAREIHDVRATMLLGDSPLGRSDRTAERYVELLEAKLRRFELGRTQGLWDAYAAFLADVPVTLNIGRGLLQSAFSGDDSVPDPLRACACSPTAGAGPPLEPVPTRDLAILGRLPHEEYPGYEIIESTRYGVDVSAVARTTADLVIGDVLDRGSETGKELRIPADDLTKHALVVGVTGSGKTTSCISVLRQAWSLGVPFLVIESAKSEYRNLLRAGELTGLRVFTAGDETIAPLRLNPFEVPAGILVQTHIDYVKSLFSAAFVLYPPMPYVLEQSIQEIYEDRGWDLARNENRRGVSARAFPRLGDLASKISDVVDRMGYDARITMDVKAGLLARVNQLRLGGGKGLMLDCRTSVDADTLFGGPCILELKSLVLDDEKAFLIGLVLIRLYEHCETTRKPGKLQHLTVIEEAHRLL
ncbi:MAG: hypothetical protein QOE68_4032, partial [Thermoanaerobaculia bacterium]|nr:hypothetical protein [Thermoanaerobaculia bacterium]